MLHIWSHYQNIIIWYHTNMLIMLTKLQAFCVLRTPFDLVFNALFNHGSHPKRSWQKYMFLQICSWLRPQGVPRHDSDGMRRQISREKHEIPPTAGNPSYTFIYPILEIWGCTWDPKIVINRVPGHPPWPEFGMYLPTISPKVFPRPKVPQIN